MSAEQKKAKAKNAVKQSKLGQAKETNGKHL
jgi:hypothetical protein